LPQLIVNSDTKEKGKDKKENLLDMQLDGLGSMSTTDETTRKSSCKMSAMFVSEMETDDRKLAEKLPMEENLAPNEAREREKKAMTTSSYGKATLAVQEIVALVQNAKKKFLDNNPALKKFSAETVTIDDMVFFAQELDASNALMKLSQKPVEASESERFILAGSLDDLYYPSQASTKKLKPSVVNAPSWSGYKLFCSFTQHTNQCGVLGIKSHTLESYAEYIGTHDQPPPRRRAAAATAMKKRRTDASGATKMIGGTAHFCQHSKNKAAQWKELEDKERERYTTEAKKINKCISGSRHQQLNGFIECPWLWTKRKDDQLQSI
jgi:hypothetical protein